MGHAPGLASMPPAIAAQAWQCKLCPGHQSGLLSEQTLPHANAFSPSDRRPHHQVLHIFKQQL